MASDADLAGLLAAVARAGASLVLVGDPRQLDAVGPGGALAALCRRRPDLVTTLDSNVRQRDPGDRLALAQLRDGSASAAIAWYADAGRVRAVPTRPDTLAAMADAWAADRAGGRDTLLLAWRRADVADLNRLARDRWDQLGHLRGDDVQVEGGRHYAAGDRLVALMPNHAAGLVTSEIMTVLSVDPQSITVRLESGRTTSIAGEGIDEAHLDYGYAVTVHRAQGATCDRAHVLAGGGGRELAYVALSRAREHTTVYAVADDLDQAVDDLRSDWTVGRHQRWITETTARPSRSSAPEANPTDLRRHLERLEGDRSELLAGTGRWRNTREGAAARERNAAVAELGVAQRTATNPTARRRERRIASRSLDRLRAAVDTAEHRWQAVGQPVEAQLRSQIDEVELGLVQISRDQMNERFARLQQRSRELPISRGISR
jgi:hypothetical protein